MPTTSTHCGLHWSELQTVFSLLIFTLTCTYVLHTYTHTQIGHIPTDSMYSSTVGYIAEFV